MADHSSSNQSELVRQDEEPTPMMDITLEIRQKPTGVPYFRPPEDTQSHSYVRLKDNRDLIDELPECVREKTLMDMVWHLNRPESLLETIGCECAMNRREDFTTEDGIEPVAFAKKGYISIIFSDTAFGADQANLLAVFNVAKAKLEAIQANCVSLECMIAPFVLANVGVEVWGLDLWLVTQWKDEETTSMLWDNWMRCVVKQMEDAAQEVWEAAQSRL